MTPAEVAADIRRVSPGALPPNLMFENGCPVVCSTQTDGIEVGQIATVYLPDDIAEAVLRDAMIHDVGLDCRSHGEYYIRGRTFDVADHGGQLGACYQAWRFAKGIA